MLEIFLLLNIFEFFFVKIKKKNCAYVSDDFKKKKNYVKKKNVEHFFFNFLLAAGPNQSKGALNTGLAKTMVFLKKTKNHGFFHKNQINHGFFGFIWF